MLKTIIVLPDGRELSSGVTGENAIRSITLTQCVNDEQELSLGSVCAGMAEITVIAPKGGFSVAEGDEFTLFQADGAERHQIGVFRSERPVRSGANTFKLTAYDRVSLLDKDLTDWLAELTGWPYTLFELSRLVCKECGVSLSNTEIPNGSHTVEKFTGSGITGRQLMHWIGQLAGRFCRATPEGAVEFGWYAPKDAVQIGPAYVENTAIQYDGSGNLSLQIPETAITAVDGDVHLESSRILPEDDGAGNLSLMISNDARVLSYFQGGLKYEDYQVAPIEKVQIKNSQEDVGTVYPPDASGSLNTYIISGNPLTAGIQSPEIIAQSLYALLSAVAYTPCTVSIPAGFTLRAGDIVTVTDANGTGVTAYLMSAKQTGQRLQLQCTGSARRDSSTAVNKTGYKSLSGKVLNLSATVDGLKAENRDSSGKIASMQLDVDGITAKVTRLERNDSINQQMISDIDQKADSISLQVSAVEQIADRAATDSWYALTQTSELKLAADGITAEVSRQSESMDGMRKDLTRVKQTAQEVELSVQSMQEEGTSKVTTSTGYTFGADGLRIQKAGQEMKNLLDETGMTVSRGDTVMLKANKDGVLATDVTVRNYLIVGSHARFEDHSNGTDGKRTACFYI